MTTQSNTYDLPGTNYKIYKGIRYATIYRPKASRYGTETIFQSPGNLTEEKLNAWVVEYTQKAIDLYNKREAAKSERKEASRKANAEKWHAGRDLCEVGDIFYTSWGYDQTNVEFYQVVEAKSNKVKYRKIEGEIVEATSHDSAKVRPKKAAFYGEEVFTGKIRSISGKREKRDLMFLDMDGHRARYTSPDETHYNSWGY